MSSALYILNFYTLSLTIQLKLASILTTVICPDNLQLLSEFSFNPNMELFKDRQHLVFSLQYESPQLSVVVINECHEVLSTTM